MIEQNRLLIVSNRLPITVQQNRNRFEVQTSSGGLVTALLPVFKDRGGVWIGWPGTEYNSEIEKVLRGQCAPEYSMEPVFLTAAEMRHFYDGCCNEILWPLFHDLQSRCDFNPVHWLVYRDVNEKFADAVERSMRRDDLVWVHDYHLMMLAECLRARSVRSRLAYFHHVPFPPPDVFEKLPWRTEILRGLMRFNTVAFQTDRDRRNFVACLRRCLGRVRLRRNGGRYLVSAEGVHCEVATTPISIDFEGFSTQALKPEVELRTREIQESLAGKRIILGVDRLDFTKGIPERLMAFRTLLEQRPDLHQRVTLVQLVVPSREGITGYRDCKARLERLVSQINGEFGRPEWSPVNYLHRHVPVDELLAMYRAADVALVTPLKDGMNLVSKEFCASRSDEKGVLVLSEFAGSADELGCGALLVNPYDAEGVAAALRQALAMPEEEQGHRMRKMRSVIQANNVFRWSKSICGHLAGEKPQLVFPSRKSQSMAQAV
ncbi:MAG: alpha,alpha-trehalose-phosphate synthase (UDP-forming) [Actinomycetota bacterium]